MSTKSQRRDRYRKRLAVELWFPHAHDLELIHVPLPLKSTIRAKIAPWVANLTPAVSVLTLDPTPPLQGIRGGDCWNVAQSFVLTADVPSVLLVEGVWARSHTNTFVEKCEEDEFAVPHSWVTVDG
ncbi:MAG: hypothetical protein WCC37_21810 [Candidatus Sulfotelmatobacter sp.]